MESDGKFIIFCSYRTKTALIKIDNETSFDYVLDLICQKYGFIDGTKVKLFYSLPNFDNCMLADDDDIDNMKFVASDLSIGRFNVNVFYEDSEIGSSHASVNSFSSDIHQDETLEVDRLPNYCPHKQKPLLSDSWKYGIKHVGQIFEGGAKEFRSILCKYSVKVGFDFEYVKNESRRVTVQCVHHIERNCKWRIHCSGESGDDRLQIKTMDNVHICGSFIITNKHRRVTADLVCDCVVDKVRVSPGISAIDVMKYMRSDFGVDASYRVCWSALGKARCEIFGDEATSFNELRWYIDEATRKNYGSIFNLEVNENENRFKRLFFTFYACIYGFINCRPMLFIDGTFLKGKFKGHMLSATAKDGNNGIFPVAFAVVDAENEDNWAWFIENLRKIIPDDRVYSIISDRHGGLIEAVPRVWPNCHHAFCIVHLKNNLRDKLSKIKGESKQSIIDKFGDCAYAPNVNVFEQHMTTLKSYKCKERINTFLERLPHPKHWSNTFFEGKRYGEMTSNAAESFNAFIGDARDKPVMKLVDTIRAKIMEKLDKSRKAADDWNSIVCPSILSKLQNALDEGRTWEIRVVDSDVYEVCSVPSVVIDIGKLTCSCFKWQLNGIPCAHAAVAIQKSGKCLDDLVDPVFHVSTYKEVYAETIYPVPSTSQLYWSCDEEYIRPPNSKTQPGRPKKRRFRSRGENVRLIKCGRCDCIGHHNRKTCRAPLLDR